MTRQVIFKVHWFLGITAGLILAWMGATGAIMAFAEEISERLTPELYEPGLPAGADLSPGEIIRQAERNHPDKHVIRLDWSTDRHRSHMAVLVPEGGGPPELAMIDRSSGRVLGEPGGIRFFNTVRDLHRWFALPSGRGGIGGQITGIAALALVFFALSGLYLRWPRRVWNWRSWLVVDFHKTGRNFWRALHATMGTWIFLLYLLSALSGLWWAYDWYQRSARSLLVGRSAASDVQMAMREGTTNPQLDPAWAAFKAQAVNYQSVRLSLPADGTPVKSITFEGRPVDARHVRQVDRYSYDAGTGELSAISLYRDRPLGLVITESMFEVHRGSFFGLAGRIAVLLSSLAISVFVVTGYLLYFSRRQRLIAVHGAAQEDSETANDGGVVVAYASQTGRAEAQARNAAAAFARAGLAAAVVPLSSLTSAMLGSAKRALFVVSTYGEGQPPDAARAFVRRVMREPVPLAELEYGVLAMGDREYPDFCAFGMSVDQWLAQSGAKALFPTIQMDDQSVEAELAWNSQLQLLGARPSAQLFPSAAWERWQLAARAPLNPESPFSKAFHLQLRPDGHAEQRWSAGDIVEIQPENHPELVLEFMNKNSLNPSAEVGPCTLSEHLTKAIIPVGNEPVTFEQAAKLRTIPTREYSAASVPEDGTLDLVVRQIFGPDRRPGIGSGFLTVTLPIQGHLSLRVRENPGFRMPPGTRPLILIGNGTGIAGLRAHLRAQVHRSQGGHWLLFGERKRAYDSFFDGELEAYLKSGILARLDRAFSRDAECGRYVQELLLEASSEIRNWVRSGAAVMICGSLQGMASSVHSAIEHILGEELLEQIISENRYKRDVY